MVDDAFQRQFSRRYFDIDTTLNDTPRHSFLEKTVSFGLNDSFKSKFSLIYNKTTHEMITNIHFIYDGRRIRGMGSNNSIALGLRDHFQNLFDLIHKMFLFMKFGYIATIIKQNDPLINTRIFSSSDREPFYFGVSVNKGDFSLHLIYYMESYLQVKPGYIIILFGNEQNRIRFTEKFPGIPNMDDKSIVFPYIEDKSWNEQYLLIAQTVIHFFS
jgi:hypothetical protein